MALNPYSCRYAWPCTSSIFFAMPYGALVSSGYPFHRSRSRNGTGASFGYAQIVPTPTNFSTPANRACSIVERAHHDVLVEEAARRFAVGADAADHGRQMDDDSGRTSRNNRDDVGLRASDRAAPFARQTTSRQPWRASAATTCRPRNPLPPVTSTRFDDSSIHVHHRTLDDVASHDQHVHVRPQKAVERLLRAQHDRFVFVERRVQQHRHAGHALEGLDQIPVAGVRLGG